MTLGAVTFVEFNIAGTSGSYVTNDVFGSETTLTGAISANGGTGTVKQAVMYDDADAMGPCELWISESTASPAADSAQFAPSDANSRLYRSPGDISFGTFIDNGGARIASWRGAAAIKAASGATSCFLTIVCRATIGTVAANAVRVALWIEQDQ